MNNAILVMWILGKKVVLNSTKFCQWGNNIEINKNTTLTYVFHFKNNNSGFEIQYRFFLWWWKVSNISESSSKTQKQLPLKISINDSRITMDVNGINKINWTYWTYDFRIIIRGRMQIFQNETCSKGIIDTITDFQIENCFQKQYNNYCMYDHLTLCRFIQFAVYVSLTLLALNGFRLIYDL